MTIFSIRKAESAADIGAAIAVERSVFEEAGLASLDPYEKYDEQSHFFGAFDQDDRCIGMARMIQGGPLLPPTFEHGVEIGDRRSELEALAQQGLLDEYATAATVRGERGTAVFYNLIRHAYRDARSRGTRYWSIITEPERATAFDRLFLLPFVRVGPDQHYMGEEEITAPWVLDFDETELAWTERHAEHFQWFFKAPLSDHRSKPLRSKRQ